jgi:hypothetical protein
MYGHQIVCHHVPGYSAASSANAVDGDPVPVPHFGLALSVEQFHDLAERVRRAGIQFIIQPHLRFQGGHKEVPRSTRFPMALAQRARRTAARRAGIPIQRPCVAPGWCLIAETNGVHLVLFGMQNGTFGPYLAANDSILISLVPACGLALQVVERSTSTTRLGRAVGQCKPSESLHIDEVLCVGS